MPPRVHHPYCIGHHTPKNNQLITRDYQGHTFTFREDGYFNMTKAAAHYGKRLDKFFSSDETREYIEAMDALHTPTKTGEFIQAKMGRYGGTFAHPKLAIRFAQWPPPPLRPLD